MAISKLRKTENLHILLWLIKDTLWVTDLKIPGTIMIFPTVGVAIWLTVKMRHEYAELMHNLAVVSWICANATWMVGEFYFDDKTRPLALVFFVVGVCLLLIYYTPRIFRRA